MAHTHCNHGQATNILGDLGTHYLNLLPPLGHTNKQQRYSVADIKSDFYAAFPHQMSRRQDFLLGLFG